MRPFHGGLRGIPRPPGSQGADGSGTRTSAGTPTLSNDWPDVVRYSSLGTPIDQPLGRRRQLDARLAEWRTMQDRDVTALNAMLRGQGIMAIYVGGRRGLVP